MIVEDNPLDADLAIKALERSGRRLAVVRVETRAEFLKELANPPDLILCDYHLPSFDAPEALDLLKQQSINVPFIILSGSIGEETAVEMIKRGADDYLLKDRIGRLDAAIQQALEQKALRDEAQRAAEHLRQSEFKYRCLFDHLMDAAYLCDAATTRIIDTNRQSERLLGLDRATILGSRLSQYFPAGALDRLHELPPDNPGASVKLEAEMAVGEHPRVKLSASLITIQQWHLLLVLVRTDDC
ncbi:MAG: hybrid sensor histidine kinase/response regulator [Rariglobus sp.]|nr:hybrid sensor histidine kinase/response regulator [Rariglobus sp.]